MVYYYNILIVLNMYTYLTYTNWFCYYRVSVRVRQLNGRMSGVVKDSELFLYHNIYFIKLYAKFKLIILSFFSIFRIN